MFGQLKSMAVTSASMLLSACSYGHKHFAQAEGPFQEPLDFVLQVNDEGKFWDQAVAERALAEIEMQSQKTNAVVVTFIHGWHHNADSKNKRSNAWQFAESLERIRKRLEDNESASPGVYRLSRFNLTEHEGIKVIGVYVGWRGKSLPMPLDYLTFWGRKAAAERVGQGDLRDFLMKLDEIYRGQSAARASGQTKLFMGMASFGHSFGGQILFKAVAPTLEQNLEEALASRKLLLAGQAPAPLTGFGDIVVLVNPALEASQYESIHRLQADLEHGHSQTPLLITLSADNDLARKVLFPMARAIGFVVKGQFRDTVDPMQLKALGEYEPQRTHNVIVLPEEATKGRRFDPNWYVDAQCRIIDFDLTDIPVLVVDLEKGKTVGVQLSPIAERHQAFSPLLVAYASGGLVIKHSGIFKEMLGTFLNDYVAIAEGKRMVLGSAQARECRTLRR